MSPRTTFPESEPWPCLIPSLLPNHPFLDVVRSPPSIFLSGGTAGTELPTGGPALFCYSPYSGPVPACLLFPEKGNQEWLFTALLRLKHSRFGMPWPSPSHPILPLLYRHGGARGSHVLDWCSGDVTATLSKLLQKCSCFVCTGKVSC